VGWAWAWAVLADRMAQFVHYYTLHGSVRPFGNATIIAGYDAFKGAHELYMVEPSGVGYVSVQSSSVSGALTLTKNTPWFPGLQKYYGTAVGKGRQGAKTEIEKLKLTELPVDQAVKEVAKM
jgi:20S proteasome subunit alpha 7